MGFLATALSSALYKWVKKVKFVVSHFACMLMYQQVGKGKAIG